MSGKPYNQRVNAEIAAHHARAREAVSELAERLEQRGAPVTPLFPQGQRERNIYEHVLRRAAEEAVWCALVATTPDARMAARHAAERILCIEIHTKKSPRRVRGLHETQSVPAMTPPVPINESLRDHVEGEATGGKAGANSDGRGRR